jgi:hypothetical protein
MLLSYTAISKKYSTNASLNNLTTHKTPAGRKTHAETNITRTIGREQAQPFPPGSGMKALFWEKGTIVRCPVRRQFFNNTVGDTSFHIL